MRSTFPTDILLADTVLTAGQKSLKEKPDTAASKRWKD